MSVLGRIANSMPQFWKRKLVFPSVFGALQLAALAANPYLPTVEKDPAPVSFKGVEWNDDYAPKDITLSAKVQTEEVAKTSWGGVFKISFTDIHSKSGKRQIAPLYFVVTDDVIALLNEEKMDEAVKRIAALDKPPTFLDSDIYAVSKGEKSLSDARTKTTVSIEKNECTYLYTHDSGHFTKLVWKTGAGLVDYEQNEGAHKDGFRLKSKLHTPHHREP